MIVGIGIDSTEIDRFTDFRTYTKKSLEKMFSPTEIEYCLEYEIKSSERFAARFAAKEAFYKAFCTAFPATFLKSEQVFRQVSIEHQKNGHIKLTINWESILKATTNPVRMLDAYVSLTHTKTVATAIVILEKN